MQTIPSILIIMVMMIADILQLHLYRTILCITTTLVQNNHNITIRSVHYETQDADMYVCAMNSRYYTTTLSTKHFNPPQFPGTNYNNASTNEYLVNPPNLLILHIFH